MNLKKDLHRDYLSDAENKDLWVTHFRELRTASVLKHLDKNDDVLA
jgi:hypothetical protein